MNVRHATLLYRAEGVNVRITGVGKKNKMRKEVRVELVWKSHSGNPHRRIGESEATTTRSKHSVNSMLLIASMVLSMALVGCMSLEERLASSDAKIKKDAEIELYQIAVATRNDVEVEKAINRITSNEVLARIAAHSEEYIARKAVERMNEDQWLYGVASMSKHQSVKVAAVSKIKSQKLLVDLYNDLYIDYRGMSRAEAELKELTKLSPYTIWNEKERKNFSKAYFGRGVYTSAIQDKREEDRLKIYKNWGFDEDEVKHARYRRVALLAIVKKGMDYETLVKVNAPLGIHHVKFWRKINDLARLREIFCKAGSLPVEEQKDFAKKVVSDRIPTNLIIPPNEYLEVVYLTSYLESKYLAKKKRTDEYCAEKMAKDLETEKKQLEDTGLSQDAINRNLDKKRKELEVKYERLKEKPSRRLEVHREALAKITNGNTNNVIANTGYIRSDWLRLSSDVGNFVVNPELRGMLHDAIKETFSLDDRCAVAKEMIEKQRQEDWQGLREWNVSNVLAAAMFTKDCIMPSMAKANDAERRSFEQLLNCVFTKIDSCHKRFEKTMSVAREIVTFNPLMGEPDDEEPLNVTLAAWADTLGAQIIVEYLESRERDPISVGVLSILVRNCVKSREYAIRLFRRFDKMADLRRVLAWRIAPEDITAELFAGETDAKVREVLTERAPQSLVDEIRKSNAMFAKELIENGKANPRHVLGGFYLGMSLSMARNLLEIQFPEMKFHVTEDGIFFDENLKDNQGFLGVSDFANNMGKKDARGVFMYFCRARNDEVYLFNFNEKLLKKLLNYDVQAYDDWQAQYGRDNHVSWRHEPVTGTCRYSVTMVNNKGSIYEKSKHPVQTFDWKNPPKEFEVDRTLKASQDAWWYFNKQSDKRYKITYFGACPDKEKLRDAGLGSRWINGVGALEGTLRFEAE